MSDSSFYNYVLSSGLLEKSTLDELADSVRARSGVEFIDELLSNEIVERELLNTWQVSQLMEGRTRFTLSRYKIVDSIGQGGYGQVFLAKDPLGPLLAQTLTGYGEFVAVKVLPFNRATPELIARFQREIELQVNLFHPHLVRYIDSGHDGNVHFMVHEYIDGGDLRQKIRTEEKLPIHTVAKLMIQIADAIACLHKHGIIHRDVKPANILLSKDGNAKLADMGFAIRVDQQKENENISELQISSTLERISLTPGEKDRNKEEDDVNLKGKLVGTADYMAPDQIRDPHHPVPAWDIYSLGCTLYQMLTGIVPFPSGDARAKIIAHLQQEPPDARMFNQAIPFDIIGLLWEMMAKNPAERIDSLEEIKERLVPWVNEIPHTINRTSFIDILEPETPLKAESQIKETPEPAAKKDYPLPQPPTEEEMRDIILEGRIGGEPYPEDLKLLEEYIVVNLPGGVGWRIRIPPVIPEPVEPRIPFLIRYIDEYQWTAINNFFTVILYYLLSPIALAMLILLILWAIFFRNNIG